VSAGIEGLSKFQANILCRSLTSGLDIEVMCHHSLHQLYRCHHCIPIPQLEVFSRGNMAQPADTRLVRSIRLADLGVEMSGILAYLEGVEQEFAPSLLYSATESCTFADKALRNSEFRAITNVALFDLVAKEVEKLADDAMSFRLVRNDVTQV